MAAPCPLMGKLRFIISLLIFKGIYFDISDFIESEPGKVYAT